MFVGYCFFECNFMSMSEYFDVCYCSNDVGGNKEMYIISFN